MFGLMDSIPEARRHDWPLLKQRKNVFTGWRQRSKYNMATRALPPLEAQNHPDGTVSFPSDRERRYRAIGTTLVRVGK